MHNPKPISSSARYFIKRLEKRSVEIKQELSSQSLASQDILFDEIDLFFKQIMSQNIFIYTVGQNGKRESTILAKAIFSMSQVIRIFYSTSFDDENSGFIRVRADRNLQLIIVERMHGIRPKSEVLYSSLDQCHVIRFLIRWLMRRIDWTKTKLANLELYRRYHQELQAEAEAKMHAIMVEQEEERVRREYEEHVKKNVKRRTLIPR
ncbi:hypothetical protein MNBD_GAMMA03-1372 [hydrothermal vent metagenome]|uniref:Uncharacterized protein n=1 Tax=hydrothermal vent metagenome TaxID=652676 RepID=A0A3B0WYH8_9ZZZZ